MTDYHADEHHTPSPHDGTQPTLTAVHWFFLVLVTLLVIVVDQLSKAYVVARLDLHESWMPLKAIRPVFRFTHVHNTGAAFGMFPEGGSIFLIIALVVSLVIVYYYREIPGSAWLVRMALGLQLGGALGNVIDRVRLGYVVDFFDVSIWPVFNVADSCIVLGVVLLALELLREEWQASRSQAGSDDNLSGSSEEEAYG